MLHNPLRGLPIPQRRNGPFFPVSGHQSRECGRKLARIGRDQFVCADCDDLRPFNIVAESRIELRQYLKSIELACGLIKCDGRLTASQTIGGSQQAI